MQNGDKNVGKPSHHFAYLCLDNVETRFRTEPISEWLCWNTQFGYLNIVFNLNN